MCPYYIVGVEVNWNDKAKAYLVPYIFWGTAYQLFLTILGVIGGASVFETFIMRMKAVVMISSGPMWFLATLYLALLIFCLSKNNIYANIGSAFLLLGIALFAPEISAVEFIFRAFVGTFFIVIGYYSQEIYHKKTANIWLILICICNIFMVMKNATVNIAARNFGNPFLFIINSCIGTWIILQFCMRLKMNGKFTSTLKKWGKYSVIILCCHSFAIQIIRIVDYKLTNNILYKFGTGEGIIIASIVMGLITIFMPMLLKVFGWTWGYDRVEM